MALDVRSDAPARPCYTPRVTGHVAPCSYRDARHALGMTQHELAQLLYCSERTIRRIERGETIPMCIIQRNLTRIAGRTRDRQRTRLCKLPNTDITIYRIDIEAYERYNLGRAIGWRHWPGYRRAAWRRWRNYYARVRAEQDAGRAIILWRNQ
jgi:transcriptional regulator with XRE-family HTH domain